MKMRDPNEIFLKKIQNFFIALSIAIAILSTILFVYSLTHTANCPACAGCVCDYLIPEKMYTYIFMMSLSAAFLTIGITLYIIRRIIITRPSIRIIQEEESHKYK